MTEYEFFRLLCDQELNLINKLDKKLRQGFIESLINKGLSIQNNNDCIINIEQLRYYDKTSYYDKQILLTNFKSKLNDIELHVLYETDSTNKAIKKINNDKINILLAEYQLSGQGRRGKQWLSPIGSNIYLSIKFKAQYTAKTSLYPLYIATIIAEFFSQSGIEKVAVKWPNDIYIDNKKSVGILLESIAQGTSQSIVLGIGINIFADPRLTSQIDQPITSLFEHTNNNELLNKNLLLSKLLPKLFTANENFSFIDNQFVIHAFEQYNWLKNKKISIIENENIYQGDFIRINNDGSLVALINNTEKNFYAAEVSVKC
ncbi:MAG: biotin--[acetyl-CoA-carboxylase] ligase [Gammaproteobacteria bacterium]|nr:biotin--[acetyl-CoA-carboxylase] ligase [Gammaproteobacteria bacterium]